MEKTKCLIIGGGPAGYTAAIYAARAAMSPILYEGPEPGGQLTTTTLVENYPGFAEGVTPQDLLGQMRSQAVRLGADLRRGTVTGVSGDGSPWEVSVDGRPAVCAQTIIIATGAGAKYLGLPSETRFRGLGVSACATCDGFFYRGRDVAVVGGGDTACEEASYLSGLCRKVYMIVRRHELRASAAMQRRVLDAPNVEMLWGCNTSEVLGDDSGVTGARLVRDDGTVFDIKVDGFFVAIGRHPVTELFQGWIRTDEQGYIVTEEGSTATNVPGVFAAGDVADPHYRQAVVAAASGCRAALDAQRFLKELE